jgi:hypothetical protein
MPELLGAMLRGAPADPRTIAPAVPPSAASALVQALRAAPEQRFATARSFGSALSSAS